MIVINGHDVTFAFDYVLGLWSGWCLAEIVHMRRERRAKR